VPRNPECGCGGAVHAGVRRPSCLRQSSRRRLRTHGSMAGSQPSDADDRAPILVGIAGLSTSWRGTSAPGWRLDRTPPCRRRCDRCQAGPGRRTRPRSRRRWGRPRPTAPVSSQARSCFGAGSLVRDAPVPHRAVAVRSAPCAYAILDRLSDDPLSRRRADEPTRSRADVTTYRDMIAAYADVVGLSSPLTDCRRTG
jgi:hypothetical protein